MRPFNIARYNNLLDIYAADRKFNKQLADANISRPELLWRLAKLFLEQNQHTDYSPCLLHRHYLLKEGERMVANGNSTMPSTDNEVVPERWYPDGEEMEHRVFDPNITLPPPPAPKFLDQFKALTHKYGIDMLGICYVPPVEELRENHIFLETLGARDREQVIQMVPIDSLLGGRFYASCWVVTKEINGEGVTTECFNCKVVCGNSDDPPPEGQAPGGPPNTYRVKCSDTESGGDGDGDGKEGFEINKNKNVRITTVASSK